MACLNGGWKISFSWVHSVIPNRPNRPLARPRRGWRHGQKARAAQPGRESPVCVATPEAAMIRWIQWLTPIRIGCR